MFIVGAFGQIRQSKTTAKYRCYTVYGEPPHCSSQSVTLEGVRHIMEEEEECQETLRVTFGGRVKHAQYICFNGILM